MVKVGRTGQAVSGAAPWSSGPAGQKRMVTDGPSLGPLRADAGLLQVVGCLQSF